MIRLLLAGVAGACFVAALIFFFAPTPNTEPELATLVIDDFLPTATAIAPTAEPEPTATEAPVSTAPIARLQIPGIGVNAEVITLGVDPDGVMQVPKGPREVAWYTFAAHPGEQGNVVMAGHVDYANYGPAVFWRLREMKAGDELSIELSDGTRFSYRVMTVTAYDADTAPVSEIVGPTAMPALTLITCTGAFDRSVREYDKRLVVRGERL